MGSLSLSLALISCTLEFGHLNFWFEVSITFLKFLNCGCRPRYWGSLQTIWTLSEDLTLKKREKMSRITQMASLGRGCSPGTAERASYRNFYFPFHSLFNFSVGSQIGNCKKKKRKKKKKKNKKKEK